MALVVEDGTGLANANSYVSYVEFETYANARGEVIPGADGRMAYKILIRGTDFIDSYRDRLSGKKRTKAQSLEYPREGAVVNGFSIDNDEIPQSLKNAQMEAALETYGGTDLQASSTGQRVTKRKVAVIELEYALGGASSSSQATTINNYPKILQWLKPLFSKTNFLVQRV